jgi:hypothetical protein
VEERRMSTTRSEGLTLRQAALIVGFAYLLNPVGFAEFSIYPKLVIPGNIEQTVTNIAAQPGLFAGMLLAYFVNFIEDIIIAWGLYFLLAPVNRALSALAAIFQLVYAAIAFVGIFNVATVYRMLTTPEYATVFSSSQLQAQVDLLLHSWRYNYTLVLVLFGIHLVLAGYLVFRSRYIPSWIGILLVINGLGYVVNGWKPYLYPNANLDYIFITWFGELVLMLWLLVWGWRIREPAQQPLPS